MSETAEVLLQRYGPRYRVYLTAVTLLGLVGPVLTTTAINIAVPDIMGSFGIGQDRAQWMQTGVLAGQTVGMLLSAWVIDSFGQRKAFVGCSLVFIASLILGGLSPNDSVLIAARIIQGIIAGMLQTLATSTIFSIFPPEKRGSAMGVFSITVIIGPALGPLFGGALIEYLNWRYVFFLTLPFNVAAALLGTLLMPERETQKLRDRFDWIGFVLLCTGMWSLLHGVSNGQRVGWNSDEIVASLIAAAIAAAGFIYWEIRSEHPLVALRLLKNSRFAGAACVSGVFGVGMFGTIYLIPLFVQTVPHFTAFEAGLVLLPGALILAVFMPLGGLLNDRMPPRPLIITGLIIFVVSNIFMLDIDANTSFMWIAMCTLIGRAGQALVLPTLNVSALRAVAPHQVRQGAGMTNFTRQLGGAFGVNLLAVGLDRRTAFYSDALTNMQTGINGSSREMLRAIEALLAQTGLPPAQQSAGALQFLGRVIHEQAYTLAFRECFLFITVAFVLALIPAWMMGRHTRR